MKNIDNREILVVEKLIPTEVYNSGNIDAILNRIAEDAKSQKLDISTEKGRKEIASLAYKVAQSKSFLDKMGKALGDDARKTIETLNSERKKCVDFLDKLKDEIRSPLTEWENREKKRISDHEFAIFKITNVAINAEQNWPNLTMDFIFENVAALESIDRDWEEFKSRAENEISNAFAKLKDASVKITTRIKEQEELTRLREQEQIRLQKERDEKIAFEAAEKAKREAELKAKEESDRVAREAARAAEQAEKEKLNVLKEKQLAEQRELAAIKEKELAEQRAKDAAIKAEKDKQIAIENERLRLERIKQAEIEAERVRENNKKHTDKINNEVVDAIMHLCIIDENMARMVVTAISTGRIPHTKISY
jgi:hypothetical protein